VCDTDSLYIQILNINRLWNSKTQLGFTLYLFHY